MRQIISVSFIITAINNGMRDDDEFFFAMETFCLIFYFFLSFKRFHLVKVL